MKQDHLLLKYVTAHPFPEAVHKPAFIHSCSHSGNTRSCTFLSASCYAQSCGYLYQIRNSTGFHYVNFGLKKVDIGAFVIL